MPSITERFLQSCLTPFSDFNRKALIWLRSVMPSLKWSEVKGSCVIGDKSVTAVLLKSSDRSGMPFRGDRSRRFLQPLKGQTLEFHSSQVLQAIQGVHGVNAQGLELEWVLSGSDRRSPCCRCSERTDVDFRRVGRFRNAGMFSGVRRLKFIDSIGIPHAGDDVHIDDTGLLVPGKIDLQKSTGRRCYVGMDPGLSQLSPSRRRRSHYCSWLGC